MLNNINICAEMEENDEIDAMLQQTGGMEQQVRGPFHCHMLYMLIAD